MKQIMEDRQFKQPILVTSAFHMPRSMMNFNQAGLAVEPYAADYKVNVSSHVSVFVFLPNGGAFTNTCITLWEYVGMLVLVMINCDVWPHSVSQ